MPVADQQAMKHKEDIQFLMSLWHKFWMNFKLITYKICKFTVRKLEALIATPEKCPTVLLIFLDLLLSSMKFHFSFFVIKMRMDMRNEYFVNLCRLIEKS